MTASEIEEAVLARGLQPLPAGAAGKFQNYLDLLLKWNARLNLTAIREPEAIVQRQFLECIFLAQQLPPLATLLDFGSGGGFPGLPIAICRPEIAVTLAESQGKKASFLQEALRTLKIPAKVYPGRVEALHGPFEAITLRAVDKMQEAIQIAASKVQPSGWLILFATQSTAPDVLFSPETIRWQSPIPISGSQQEVILFGQKSI